MFAKAQADDCHSLDVWKVQHDGCLAPGASGGLRWLRGDTEVASIGYRCLPTGALELSYRIPRTGQAYRDVVWTETMPMRRGRRVYWVCPGCHRLVQKLYLGGALFRCRDCYDLSYKTRQERGSRGLWLYSKAHELDRRLEALGHPSVGDWRSWKRWRRLREERARISARLLDDLRRFGADCERRLARRGVPLADEELPLPPPEPPAQRPRGRPKEKRAYVRRAPLPELTPVTSERSAYCVKCRDRRRLKWPRPVTLANGRSALRGRCAVCGTKVARILRVH